MPKKGSHRNKSQLATAERDARIIEYFYGNRHSQCDIAKAVGCHHNTVRNVLDRHTFERITELKEHKTQLIDEFLAQKLTELDLINKKLMPACLTLDYEAIDKFEKISKLQCKLLGIPLTGDTINHFNVDASTKTVNITQRAEAVAQSKEALRRYAIDTQNAIEALDAANAEEPQAADNK